jgi:hypothetical protein
MGWCYLDMLSAAYAGTEWFNFGDGKYMTAMSACTKFHAVSPWSAF